MAPKTGCAAQLGKKPVALAPIKDTSLEVRLAMMKRILSHPEIVGPSGEIRDDAIGHLRKRAYFSPPELLKIGTELAEVIPDGGKASKAVEKRKEEADTNK
jgi:hypothetical protein